MTGKKIYYKNGKSRFESVFENREFAQRHNRNQRKTGRNFRKMLVRTLNKKERNIKYE